ncbi:restriction endonuclease subunit S [Bacteroides caccae]|uniref:restriction endonuclease subunit S n=1 Tax=Bacteroides caccae TaxID=47678 RepID=UPI000EFF055C|nr:restriction endonuclease subunit S [Bacteroides caccae]RHG51913.1 type I restriction endonuclease [Bacteroides caccae]
MRLLPNTWLEVRQERPFRTQLRIGTERFECLTHDLRVRRGFFLSFSLSDTSHYENVPFEIPEGWAWCRLEDIVCELKYGTSEKSSSVGKIAVLRMGNITNVGTIDYSNLVYSSNDEDIEQYSLEKDDLLFNRTNSSDWVGKTAIYKREQPAIYAGYLIRVRPLLISADYLNTVMNSGYYRDWCYVEKTDAVNQSNINAQKLSQLMIPIPPLEEQGRIVVEMTQWISLIDIVKNCNDDLQTIIKQAKSKILDLAIHGKLVPQDPNDEPAIELLKRINPDFTPCDNGHYRQLPQGWTVCRLEQITDVLDNLRKPINSNERSVRIKDKRIDELYPYYGATGQVGLIDDYITNGHYLLLGEDGAPFLDKSAVKSYSISGKCWVNNHAHILSPKINFDFLRHTLNHIDYSEYVTGSTRLKLTQNDMRSIKILLPPFAEQQRIVIMVERLFSNLDKIIESL